MHSRDDATWRQLPHASGHHVDVVHFVHVFNHGWPLVPAALAVFDLNGRRGAVDERRIEAYTNIVDHRPLVAVWIRREQLGGWEDPSLVR